MQKFIIFQFIAATAKWQDICEFDCIFKAITFYDKQLSYHPTSLFIITTVIVESKF